MDLWRPVLLDLCPENGAVFPNSSSRDWTFVGVKMCLISHFLVFYPLNSAEKTLLVGDSVKKMGILFEELGFNKNSSPHTQRAFFRHLVQSASRPNVQNSDSFSEQKAVVTTSTEFPSQLSFDPAVLKAGNK